MDREAIIQRSINASAAVSQARRDFSAACRRGDYAEAKRLGIKVKAAEKEDMAAWNAAQHLREEDATEPADDQKSLFDDRAQADHIDGYDRDDLGESPDR